MPRHARIDAPTALHHIVIRGNERRKIFRDDEDRNNFLSRLGMLLQQTSTACYAWVLLSNHVHLLLRTGMVPIATLMQRLLTGYAQQFNRRHHRSGHLFQNRYKSILCEDEPYFLELVRYIHLNPVRAGIVKTIDQLAGYHWCGYGCLMGNGTAAWQDTDSVLKHFGKTAGRARRQYRRFMEDGFHQGRKPELTGGGLLRSYGGWSAIRKNFKRGIRIKGDERILGSSDFVGRVLREAEEHLQARAELAKSGIDFETILEKVAGDYGIDPQELKTGTRNRRVAEARAILCYCAVRHLGERGATVAGRLQISPSAVSKSVQRGHAVLKKRKVDETLFV